MSYYSIAESFEFTEVVYDYFIHDEAFLQLQEYLLRNPDAGDVIQGTSLRKLRWPDPRRGKGKRGGLRLIYPYLPEFERLLLIDIYDKGEQDDLSAEDRKEMRQLVEDYRAELARKRGTKR